MGYTGPIRGKIKFTELFLYILKTSFTLYLYRTSGYGNMRNEVYTNEITIMLSFYALHADNAQIQVKTEATGALYAYNSGPTV
jgi:hypothetical protein